MLPPSENPPADPKVHEKPGSFATSFHPPPALPFRSSEIIRQWRELFRKIARKFGGVRSAVVDNFPPACPKKHSSRPSLPTRHRAFRTGRHNQKNPSESKPPNRRVVSQLARCVPRSSLAKKQWRDPDSSAGRYSLCKTVVQFDFPRLSCDAIAQPGYNDQVRQRMPSSVYRTGRLRHGEGKETTR